jgi:hypothetical protein
LEEFYKELPYKFDIVDPLDRVFKPPEEDPDTTNQALTVAKLKEELVDLSSIEGEKLNAPLSQTIMVKINKLFTTEDKKCH